MNYYTKLLKTEWLKYSSSTLVRLVAIVYILMAPFIIFLAKSILKNAPKEFPSSSTLFEFPTIWDYQGYIGNWMVSMLLGFLIIYIITNEVTNKTMRQNIINGYSRKDYFLSKLTVIVALSIIATIIYYISCLVIGAFHTPGFDLSLAFDNNFASLRFFLMSIGYLILAALIAFVVRRGTLSIMLYFVYVLFLEFLLRMLQMYYFKNRAILFWPANATEDLMPNPIFKMGDFWLEKEWGFSIVLTYTEAVVTTIIFTAGFIYLTWRSISRKDL